MELYAAPVAARWLLLLQNLCWVQAGRGTGYCKGEVDQDDVVVVISRIFFYFTRNIPGAKM